MQIQCPGCSALLEVGDDQAGQAVACPHCAAQMQVPSVPAGAEEGAAAPGELAAAAEEPTKVCPFCGKTVLLIARKCKHCKQDIPEGTDAESIRRRLEGKEAKLSTLLSAGGMPKVSWAVGGKIRPLTVVMICLCAASAVSAAVGSLAPEHSDLFVLAPLGMTIFIIAGVLLVVSLINDLMMPSIHGRTTPEKGTKAFLRGLCAKRYKFAYACLLPPEKDELVRLRPPLEKLKVRKGKFAFGDYRGFRDYWKGLLHSGGVTATVSRIKAREVRGDFARVSAVITLKKHSTTGFLLFGAIGAMMMGDKEVIAVSKLLRRIDGQWWVVNGELQSAEDQALDVAEKIAASS
jgi:hypothetical protein